ncbi:MAG: c-type cytochrome [Bdellovibrionales bacterium]|nr:c-type cytochrome [Bdellovibrionales bacterium]
MFVSSLLQRVFQHAAEPTRRRSVVLVLGALLAAPVANSFSPSVASALPWDYDMYRQQSLRSNEVARAPVAGTVPVGRQPFTMTIEQAEESLENPVPVSKHSVWRGQRLFNSNCLTCHGPAAKGDGPVGPKLGVPDITQDFYRQKSDGRVFGVVHYGLRAMPRYGFKFSDAQKWDLVNYVRFLQGADVPGMVRPDSK